MTIYAKRLKLRVHPPDADAHNKPVATEFLDGGDLLCR
jgi:hypothetical protein